MKLEHTVALRERYPLILANSSIDIGDGWFTLLDCLLEQLQTRANAGSDMQPEAVQIRRNTANCASIYGSTKTRKTS